MKSFSEYTKNPDLCRFCNSDETERSSAIHEGNKVIMPVFCQECSKEWDEIYFLSAIVDGE